MSAFASIEALTTALFTLPESADRTQAAELLGQLRQALARGLDDTSASDLRAFATLADRFGFHPDAWNATALLRRRGPLDAHARLIAARAFIELFGDMARKRPRVLDALLGADDGAPTDVARANLLVRWLHHVDQQLDECRYADAVATLAAVQLLSSSWWPATTSDGQPAAFTSAFVQRARAIAEAEAALGPRDHATAARSWAAALRWSAQALDGDEGEPDSDVAEPDRSTEETTSPRTASAERIEQTAQRITDQGRRIWVIGALAAKWPHLVGVAKTLGIGPKVLEHVDYGDLRQRSVMDSLNVASDVGVLIGPVPHKVADVGRHASLITQLQREAGLPVVELRANDGSGTLKITKASFRAGLLDLLTEITASEYVPIALAPTASRAQPYRPT